MKQGNLTESERQAIRLGPLLAVALLLFRLLLPLFPATVTEADHGHQHATEERLPSDSQPSESHDRADGHHEVCHFCRLQDTGLPPPSSVPVVARSLAPTAVLWLLVVRDWVPTLDFLVIAQARAPPQNI
ncbi:hypothetical protein SAE02_71250 [Skermanella aerolata]|uniref:DUF2946 domain-containing protein n=1 Tax=Skermanella aerolata TaxID=393310 RepID=A0A512E2P6_9PROT|nr:hypothetical protein SAE02_71250 [Skermanella aerolata]